MWRTGSATIDGNVWRAIPGVVDEHQRKKYELTNVNDLEPAVRAKREQMAAQWYLTRTKLIQTLHKYAKALLKVDQVVCFALDSLHCRSPRSSVQHPAATTVRDTLEDLQKAAGLGRSFEVVSQDPAYDARCKQILNKELGIRAVTDFEGFLSITENTFVTSIAPSAPIVEIIADITSAYNGPAALLCNKISDDYLAPDEDPKGVYGSD